MAAPSIITLGIIVFFISSPDFSLNFGKASPLIFFKITLICSAGATAME